MASHSKKVQSNTAVAALLDDFDNIDNFDFGRTPTKVPDSILDNEKKVVPRTEAEIEVENRLNGNDKLVDIRPSDDESEVVPKTPLDGDFVQDNEDEFIEGGEVDEDGEDGDGIGIGTSDTYEAMADQLVNGIISQGIMFLGTISYDNFVKLNTDTQSYLDFVKNKLRDGKATEFEQINFMAINALMGAMQDARELYLAEVLPMSEEEKDLSKRALINFWTIKQTKISPSTVVLTNLFTLITKRATPVFVDSRRFGKATYN
jgi:hypothetical protein